MITLHTSRLHSIALLGMHCDDIAIGAGATLLTLARANPGLQVHALVFSGGGTERETEETLALHGFCPGAEITQTVLDVPDGRAPAHWDRVKNELARFRRSCDPQVVFAPQRNDAHQDHRMLAELAPTEFRDHLILGYEILKWEADTPVTTVFYPVSAVVAEEKAQLLVKHYPSQVEHDWFDEEAFLGLTRMRGVQCHSPHAEAFVMEKMTMTFGGSPA